MYWEKHHDGNFWIENASLEWNEVEVPFHTVARLTLLPKSVLQPEAAAATYIDITGHSTPDSTPLGSMNRARWAGEVASRKARMQADSRLGLGRASAAIQGGTEQTNEEDARNGNLKAAS